MPPDILSSPFLTLSVIDTLLSRPQPPDQRVQLLSARLYLLTNPPPSYIAITPPSASPISPGNSHHTSNATRSSKHPSTSTSLLELDTKQDACGEKSKRPASILDTAEVLSARLDLSKAYLDLERPGWGEAESEANLVESTCRRLLKRQKKWDEVDTTGGRNGAREDKEKVEPGDREGKKAEGRNGAGNEWAEQLRRLRIGALEVLLRVDEELGKVTRADRWRKTIRDLRDGS